MQKRISGIAFRETMAGYFSLGVSDPKTGAAQGEANKTQLALHATIKIDNIDVFIADPEHRSGLTGSVDFAPLGIDIPAPYGVFALFAPGDEPGLHWMVYELGFEHSGKDYYLAGKKEVRTASVFKLWPATTTLYTRLHEGRDSSGPVIGAGVLSLGVSALTRLLSTFHASNAPTFANRLVATSKFAAFFTRSLVSTYILRR